MQEEEEEHNKNKNNNSDRSSSHYKITCEAAEVSQKDGRKKDGHGYTRGQSQYPFRHSSGLHYCFMITDSPDPANVGRGEYRIRI